MSATDDITVVLMEDIKPGMVLYQYEPMFSLGVVPPQDIKVVSVHLYERSVELVLEDDNVLKGYRGWLSRFPVRLEKVA